MAGASAVFVSGFASSFFSVFGSSFLGSSFFATVGVLSVEVVFGVDLGVDFFLVEEEAVLLVPPEGLPLVVSLTFGGGVEEGLGSGAGGAGSGAGVSFFFTKPEIRLRNPFFSPSASSPNATETISVETTNTPKSRLEADRNVEREGFMRRLRMLRDGYGRRD